jgi:GNAT superfamily N-acetyltransferase
MIRAAQPADEAFIIEMARLAAVIEDQPLPPAATVTHMLPTTLDTVLVATTAAGTPIGAAWWHFHDPPLLDPTVPEMGLAVLATERGRGVGTTLIAALAAKAASTHDRIVLNVHVRNPAIRLYSRNGFEVAGRGRGPLGVAMLRHLRSDVADP